MVLVRNRKPSNVGIQLKSEGPGPGCRVLQFKPGTHDYKEEDLDLINTSSKGVRAYLEGDDPVLAILEHGEGKADPTPPEKKSAAELKELIAQSNDLDWLRSVLKKDGRTTVNAAADHRIAELEAGVAGADTGDPAVAKDGETE
jgi:hypothetical protein